MRGYLGGLTGWSGGGRRPITYGLMPGQMRNTRVNIFQQGYMMPMATCYYAEPPQCGCNQDSGMPKWMQWMMGFGMISQLFGGIFSGIFGGGSSEGAGGASKNDAQQQEDLASIRSENKDYTIIQRKSDGQWRATNKKTGELITADSLTELWDTLDGLKSNKKTTTSVSDAETKYPKTVGDQMAENYIGAHKDKLSEGSITYNPETGKFKYDGKEYDYTELDTAIQEAKTSTNSAAPTASDGASPSNTGASGLGTYRFQDGDTWYSIVQKYTLPAGTTMRDAIGQLEKLNGLNLNMQQRATNKIGPKQQVSNGNIRIPNEWTLKTT